MGRAEEKQSRMPRFGVAGWLNWWQEDQRKEGTCTVAGFESRERITVLVVLN